MLNLVIRGERAILKHGDAHILHMPANTSSK